MAVAGKEIALSLKLCTTTTTKVTGEEDAPVTDESESTTAAAVTAAGGDNTEKITRKRRMPVELVDSHVSRSKHQRVPRFEDDGSSTVGAEVIEFLNKEADFFNEFHDRLAKADAFVRRKLETHGFVELDDEYNTFIQKICSTKFAFDDQRIKATKRK
jgi:Tfp pilus assembly major pilin PilA